MQHYEKPVVDVDVFSRSRDCFESIVASLSDDKTAALTHAELEDQIRTTGNELLRSLFQDHLDLRALTEQKRVDVIDADGMLRSRTEKNNERKLETVFGGVEVSRLAYRTPGLSNLNPADAVLNLPQERHSHGLRRFAAIESTRGSFEAASDAIERATGVSVGKRQVEKLAYRSAVDIADFYESRERKPAGNNDVLVISADGKGVVMRPDALREQTAKAAKKNGKKLSTRLSKGEKRNCKRMAEVGAVYDLAAVARSPGDIIPEVSNDASSETNGGAKKSGPVAQNKWLTASVENSTATVIAAVFDEAQRRDPKRKRPWVALVDGNAHQIDRIKKESKQRRLDVNIVVDFIHVLEYVWKAAWSFFDEGDPDVEAWVASHARRILHGDSGVVAAAISRKATTNKLSDDKRKGADKCVDYLTALRPYLDYATALQQGWPIATGIIEGACRHLVKDRMDVTGARWGLQGAEAILSLRAIVSNGDFDDYWKFHLAQEHERVHRSRFLNGYIPGEVTQTA